MKLWEVLKALEENPKKKFEHETLDQRAFNNTGGSLIISEGVSRKLIYSNGWQEVKQPVTWQEALEAWAVEGKTIRCKDDECDWLFLGHRSVLKDTAGPIDRFQINGGTWYIEN